MKVIKFGGTSIGSAERIREVVKLINNSESKIVILSAMSSTTNMLTHITELLSQKKYEIALMKIKELEDSYINIVDELLTEKTFNLTGKEIIESHFNFTRSFITEDIFTLHEEKAILAQGELISTALFHQYLLEQKFDYALISALNFMRIDANGEPDHYYIKENLHRELAKYPQYKFFITQGYICRNLFGEIDNLKRGGSDYTASLIGAALSVEEIQIWTDINGFHNNDPRYVANTKPIAQLSFDEAAELAYFGAKILHPSSMLPAKFANIPVRLKNTMQPADPGTLITSSSIGNGIKAIAAKDGITAIKIKSGRMLLAYGFLRKVFEVFERYKTSIDMITTSEVAVSVTIDNKAYLNEIVEELNHYGTVEVNREQTIICIVGENIVEQRGVINKVFDALKQFHILMISYGGSKHNISIIVNSRDKQDALVSLNNIFPS